MLAPAVELVLTDFHISSAEFSTFVVSIFVLGFACGPLLLAPLSELYGRVVIYNITNILFLAFTIMCAISKNGPMLLAFRFLSGFAGVATIAIGSGTIADIMPREKRGKAVSVWSVGTILGPMVGPIIGGYVTETLGWRWMFWIISIAVSWHAPRTVFCSASDCRARHPLINHHQSDRDCYHSCLRHSGETYPAVLLERKAAKLPQRKRKRQLPIEARFQCRIRGAP